MVLQVRLAEGPSVDQGKPVGPAYGFRLKTTIRGTDKAYWSDGRCEWRLDKQFGNRRPAIYCTVECDGGAIVIDESISKRSVYVRLDYPGGYLRMSGSCDGMALNQGFDLEPGKDDKFFRLDAESPRLCLSAFGN
jgi:hypothetical protein